jgi:hypothetical protein
MEKINDSSICVFSFFNEAMKIFSKREREKGLVLFFFFEWMAHGE